jgi:hypothetical protein
MFMERMSPAYLFLWCGCRAGEFSPTPFVDVNLPKTGCRLALGSGLSYQILEDGGDGVSVICHRPAVREHAIMEDSFAHGKRTTDKVIGFN